LAKGPHAFRTISEAAEELGVPQHVLRFWESRFSFIRPMKRAGGRRFYRPQDIAVLAGVRTLLHGEGYTIKGVQKLHKDFGLRRILAGQAGEGEADVAPDLSASDLPLFIEDISPSVEAESATLVSEQEAVAPRGLRPEARRRLNRALDDLTSVQTRLDALLRGE
jgi:DNA-binding transcriptional MerR regulator